MNDSTVDLAAALQLAATMTDPRREATLAILWGALKRMEAMGEDELRKRDRSQLFGELIEAELTALASKFADLTVKPLRGGDQ